MKTCRICKQTKSKSDFPKRTDSPDGLRNNCKLCRDAYTKAYFSKHMKDPIWKEKTLARIRKSHAKYNAAGKRIRSKNKCTIEVSKYRKRHPEKYKAQWMALRAFPIMQPCEICGNSVTERHHDDYSKPFQIRWLCKQHHNQHHFIVNQQKRTNQICERQKKKYTNPSRLFAKF